MVISGLPTVDVEDMRAHTEYEAGLSVDKPLIKYFWRAVRSFNHEQRVKLVQFVTGTGRIPVGGFANLAGSKYVVAVDCAASLT